MIIVDKEGKLNINFDNVAALKEVVHEYKDDNESNSYIVYELVALLSCGEVFTLAVSKKEEDIENIIVAIHENYITEQKFRQMTFKQEEEKDIYNDFSMFYIGDYLD